MSNDIHIKQWDAIPHPYLETIPWIPPSVLRWCIYTTMHLVQAKIWCSQAVPNVDQCVPTGGQLLFLSCKRIRSKLQKPFELLLIGSIEQTSVIFEIWMNMKFNKTHLNVWFHFIYSPIFARSLACQLSATRWWPGRIRDTRQSNIRNTCRLNYF